MGRGGRGYVLYGSIPLQENIGLYPGPVRDWSLITGRGGGATKREGGHVKFHTYEKGMWKKF